MSIYQNNVKPLADVLFASVAFVLLIPVLCLITFIQIIVHKGSPIFFQKRPGKDEKLFTLIKFRTIGKLRSDNDELLPAELKLTTFGSFLRFTSLDELPQLINVIKGDMSLVGPRPLLVEYLPLYNSKQKRRHAIRPGMTGWAQVNGRNSISWEEKFELDLWYIDNVSFKTDLKILVKTAQEVLKSFKSGRYVQLEAKKFQGI
jgi:lipopolysaccharide/colanic/teichoic acid biosynthesis glycosyltransferase